MSGRQILALPVSVQRDVSALHGKRAALTQEAEAIRMQLVLLGRTAIGLAGLDLDAMVAAGWTWDMPEASVVLTPPPEQAVGPALVVDPPVELPKNELTPQLVAEG